MNQKKNQKQNQKKNQKSKREYLRYSTKYKGALRAPPPILYIFNFSSFLYKGAFYDL